MSDSTDMKVDPSRAAALTSQLQAVTSRIAAASKPGRPVSLSLPHEPPILNPPADPPRRRLQAQARQRHPSPSPRAGAPARALWRELRAGAARQGRAAAALRALALH